MDSHPFLPFPRLPLPAPAFLPSCASCLRGRPMGSGRSRPIAIRATRGMNTRIARWRGEVKHQFAEDPCDGRGGGIVYRAGPASAMNRLRSALAVLAGAHRKTAVVSGDTTNF